MHAFEFTQTVDLSHSVTVTLPPESPVGTAKIIVLFPEKQPQQPVPGHQLHNIAEFTAWLETQAPTGRSGEDIDRQIKEERESWGD